MRNITRIFLHCSATAEGVDVKTGTIKIWHVTPKPNGRGWSDIGYHYVYELDGSEHLGRPIERPGAGVHGMNEESIHLCYVGGCRSDGKTPKDTRTPEQKARMYARAERLLEEHPGATVHGHNEFAAKACPSFDVQKDWQAYKSRGLSPDITPGLKPDDMTDENFEGSDTDRCPPLVSEPE